MSLSACAKRTSTAWRASLGIALALGVGNASALPGFGDTVNAACAAQERVPASPYDAESPFTSETGCQLCHDAGPAGGVGAGRIAMGDSNGPDDIDFFCQLANTPPSLAAIGNKTVQVGETLEFVVNATDEDTGEELEFSLTDAPTGAELDDNFDGSAVFSWTPEEAGDYSATITVTDLSEEAASETFAITVSEAEPVNLPPVLSEIGDQAATTGVELVINLSATDPDEDDLMFSAGDLPTGAVLDDAQDGTASITWTPDAGQESVEISVSVSDGDLSDDETFTIVVNEANRAPELAAIGQQMVVAGETLEIGLSASDEEGDNLSFEVADAPDGSTFMDNEDGTASFAWPTVAEDVGEHAVTFIVTDDGVPVGTDMEVVTIIVLDADDPEPNQAPTLDPIGNKSGVEGELLMFNVTATDPDGDPLTLSAEGLPDGAAFDEVEDGSGLFSWTPNVDDVGNHTVTFFATEIPETEVTVIVEGLDGPLQASEEITITIDPANGEDVNRPPELNRIGGRKPPAGSRFRMTFGASDPDGDALTFTASGLPEAAEFTDNGDGTAKLFWFTQNPDDIGEYELMITVSDGEFSDSETSVIIIRDPNKAPEFAGIGMRKPPAGVRLRMTVRASDADGDGIMLSAENLPDGATFMDNGDGTGMLEWRIPLEAEGEEHTVTFTATDDHVPPASSSATSLIIVKPPRQ